MTEFIDINILVTLTGCVTLTTLFTELCKIYVKTKKSVDPKWYSLIFSAVFVTARQLFLIQDYTPEGWFMTAVNILVCLTASIGVFEIVGKPLERTVSNKTNSDL